MKDHVNNISLLIPISVKDSKLFTYVIDFLFEFLPISNIILICNPKLIKVNVKKINTKIKIIDENQIIDFTQIKECIQSRFNSKYLKRAGWYYQQFLKMAFSQITDDDFYLVWDSDTIPLKKIELFNKNKKPFFDFKTEYHKPYFETLAQLIPNYCKSFENSFISEHMVINAKYMRELIDLIESNEKIKGKRFYEKIINTINTKDFLKSGFSEFETYGTYVYKNYPNAYVYRPWISLRTGKRFLSPRSLNNKSLVEWLSKYYDAISFEKSDKGSLKKIIVKSEFFRRRYNAKDLEKINLISCIKNIINLFLIKFISG